MHRRRRRALWAIAATLVIGSVVNAVDAGLLPDRVDRLLTIAAGVAVVSVVQVSAVAGRIDRAYTKMLHMRHAPDPRTPPHGMAKVAQMQPVRQFRRSG